MAKTKSIINPAGSRFTTTIYEYQPDDLNVKSGKKFHKKNLQKGIDNNVHI